MLPILIIQNDPVEGAGQISRLLDEAAVSDRTVFGDVADYASLAPHLFSGLIILGGAQSAYETDVYPYLQKEIDLCRLFIDEGKPVAGFCLGAQLLARTLGGEVRPNDQKEIGWYDLHLKEAAANDPIMKGHPQRLNSYHFHGDVIDSVPGATLLASSAMTPWQLFRYGKNAYGFQYHAEVDNELIETMCRNNATYMTKNGFDADDVISASKELLPDFQRNSATVLKRWIALCAGAD